MRERLTLSTIGLLLVPPVLWAGNTVIGKAVQDAVSPVTLNLLRWVLAFFLLLPLAGWVLRAGSGLWANLPRFALLGLLGVGCYNALQYLALKTSSPLNVTLVASSIPIWIMLVGSVFFSQRLSARQIAGALLSMAGVLVLLCRGEPAALQQLRLVPGDLYVLLAALAWAFYSWLLLRPGDPPRIRGDWAAFLMAQVVPGIAWSALFGAAEWTLTDAHIAWSWPLAAALLYIAVGPAILAYRCWGMGVQRAGPELAGFFSNLTPLFTALLSATFLGELPQTYHGASFALIVGGILVASRR